METAGSPPGRGPDQGPDQGHGQGHGDGSGAVIRAAAVLDAAAGAEITDEVRAAVGAGAERVDVDLRGVEDFDDAGTAALRTCRSLAAPHECALHFRTSPGAGREALFLAFNDLDVETETLVD